MVHRPQTIQNAPVIAGRDRFLIAKNPDEASSLKYLVRLPIDDGVILKVRDTWPTTARVYCHPFDGAWPDPAELVDDVPVVGTEGIVFADSRKFAEEWTYRFLATALADIGAVSDPRAKVST